MKVGIVGLDSFFFTQMFTTHLQSIAGIELVGCTTLGVEEDQIKQNNGLTSEEFSRKFALPVYRELDQLVEQGQVEAVCLTTRPSRMPKLLKWLVEKGIHVYIAKPVAVYEEDLNLLEGIDPSVAVVSAGPTARFDPVIRQAQERISKGEIGRPTAIRVLHQHGMLKFWPQSSWYYEKEEGGIEHFLAWYCYDLIRWFTGQDISSIQGIGANTVDQGSPHDDVLKGVCQLSDGGLASFDVLFNVSWPYPSFEIEVIGTTGALRVKQDHFDADLYTSNGKVSFGRIQHDSLADELKAWVKACQGEETPSLQLKDIIQLVKAGLSLEKAL